MPYLLGGQDMAKKQTKVTVYLEDDEVKKCTIDGQDVDPAASSTNGQQITININSNKSSDAQDSEEWDDETLYETIKGISYAIVFGLTIYWVFF